MEMDKTKALDAAVKQIEKDFGKGAIMRWGEAGAKMSVETIPTGALSLDIALGVGGIPRGRVIEIFGPESSGKTTVALHMIAEAQKAGGYAAFIDAEHAIVPPPLSCRAMLSLKLNRGILTYIEYKMQVKNITF